MNEAKRLALRAFVAVVAVLYLAGSAFSASPKPSSNSKIVTFAADTPVDARKEIIQKAGGTIVRELDIINGYEVEFKAGFKAMSDATLKSKKEIKNVAPNTYVKWIEVSMPNFRSVTLPSAQQVLRQARQNTTGAPAIGAASELAVPDAASMVPWGVQRVGAPKVWDRGVTGAGIKVGVIDTGIDYTHPALAGNYKGGYNAVEPGKDPKDDHGHGTHVSGTIAADGDNIVGVAPKASLYAIKVLDSSGGGTIAGVIDGINWAVKNKMDVVNMSLGGPSSAELEAAVKAAYDAGVTIVAAAGNDPSAEVSAPACYPQAIAISASDSSDALASFSSTGPQVAFIAPGVKVPSTWLGGGLKSISGTSMATPHVTGLAVLAYSMGARSPDAIRSALKAAAKPLPNLKPEQQGAGMIDASLLGR
jgi:subtilisin family serine protease